MGKASVNDWIGIVTQTSGSTGKEEEGVNPCLWWQGLSITSCCSMKL